MIPPNNFDKFMLVLGFIGLFLSILTIVMVDIQFVVLVGWLFMIASIALLFKLLGG